MGHAVHWFCKTKIFIWI